MRLKAYKYRIYPTKIQKELINKTFGCCRYVYNWALSEKMSYYQSNKKSISLFTLCNNLTINKQKEETKWLNEVCAQSLQYSLRQLDSAYTNFFKKRAGFPKFKSKHINRQSFSIPQNNKVDFDKSRFYTIKFKDGIKTVFDRQFTGKIRAATISKNPTNKYYVSILVEEPVDIPIPEIPEKNKTLGIDLGIKSFLTDSDGNTIENPKYLECSLNKLKKQQRILSKKKKDSNNRNKQRIKVAKIHEKIANQRKDFLHKITRKLVDNQNYTSIAIEDLKVQKMMQNNYCARYISQAGWYTFRQYLEYKCNWYGKNLLIIGQFEPSSKLCTCGYYNKSLKLTEREWKCPKCNIIHDRDILAANNIKHFAFCSQNTYNKNKAGEA